jgi:hypothetical protein
LGISRLVKRYFKLELFQARKKRERDSIDLENLSIFTRQQIAEIRQLFDSGENDAAWQMIERIIEEKTK